MSLTQGARLGPYEITGHVGAGGMGEVYRARDTRLGRDVAIKVLPEAFAGDADRMARFAREAQVLASLNYPGIAALYGLEETQGTRALVMELVEGETLAERLSRGVPPLEELLAIAKQIAEALEYAHERGVVHRDLKPANVKVRPDGAVKLLDFGLAKALAEETVSPDLSDSPTLSAVATIGGIVLGTAAYMSPEQAKGKAADRRSDIWSFGVVLYEMLARKRAYAGGTAAETMANVMFQEPDWGALPGATPPRLRELVRRCLVKDPRKRLQAIGEARVAIEECLTDPSLVAPSGPRQAAPPDATAPGPVPGRPLWWPFLMAASFLILGLGIGERAPWRRAQAPAATARLSVELGADASLTPGFGPVAILSPDGATLAFAAQKASGEAPVLHVRRLDQLQAAALSGTEEVHSPFFSPDGHWIAFFAGGKLKKVATSGGAAVTLCDAQSGRGGWWAEDGTIVFQPDNTGRMPLHRVPSAGGRAEPLLSLADGEVAQRWPQVLPGGGAVLFTSHTVARGFENASLVVQQLPSGTRKVVQRGAYHGRYADSGHLLYIHEGTLFAAPFDPRALETTGPPVAALSGVMSNPDAGGSQFSLSRGGTLVYLPGSIVGGAAAPIHWLERDGRTSPLRAAPAWWANPAFSPDGRRLAMNIDDGMQSDIWVYEWERDVATRLTFDPADDRRPAWTPDGRRIAFCSPRVGGRRNLYWQRADGSGEAERLTDGANDQNYLAWHPSGRLLAFTEVNPRTGADLMVLEIEGGEASGFKPRQPEPFLNGPARESEPAFSSDGRWLAYLSNESGRDELYVRPFPGPGGKWQVSTSGASAPVWSRSRQELFYLAPDQRIMLVSYSVAGGSFRPEKPRAWSEARVGRGSYRYIDLHPDGQRFAVLKGPDAAAESKRDKVVFVFGFHDELRRLSAANR
jgi:serine/threonine-protein kinase